MHQEIETLIEVAIANGVVTEEERAMVLQKAVALGEDVDEVEMILEGRIAQSLKTSNNVAIGSERSFETKCPNCGEKFIGIFKVCENCGYASNERNLIKSLLDLTEKLDKIDREKYNDNYERLLDKTQIIKRYKLPQDVEKIKNVIEYALFVMEKTTPEDGEIEAWYDLGWSAIEKAISKSKEQELVELFQRFKIRINDIYKEAIERNRKNYNTETKKGGVNFLLFIGVASAILLGIYGVIALFSSLFFGADIWVFW